MIKHKLHSSHCGDMKLRVSLHVNFIDRMPIHAWYLMHLPVRHLYQVFQNNEERDAQFLGILGYAAHLCEACLSMLSLRIGCAVCTCGVM